MAPPTTYEALAGLIDLPLLKPQLSDEDVIAGLELARRYALSAAVVRACDIDLAARTLKEGAVKAAAACGYPYGFSNTATKLYEARDLLRRGAREIDLELAVSKLLSREFQYVQSELLQMSELCHKEGAHLKVGFESQWLTEELKIIACRCCERAEVDCVKTGVSDISLLRKHLPAEVALQAAGGIRTLDQALEAWAAGAARLATSTPAPILDEWKARLTPPPSVTQS